MKTDKAQPGRYHHGDLREALLTAAESLVAERGTNGFSVADAARLAGVSAAAPYRHFKDRADVLGQLAARGFEELSQATRRARDAHDVGSMEAMVAFGHAYVDFVSGRPGLFHVMWNEAAHHSPHAAARACGGDSYALFLETVEQLRASQGLQLGAYEVGTPLWAMVHGLASLLLGTSGRLNGSPGHLFEMVDRTTRAYVQGLELQRRASAVIHCDSRDMPVS